MQWMLGIESTAHTLSYGAVTANGDVLPSTSSMIRAKEGGIHPRDAADHHAEMAGPLLRRMLDDNSLDRSEMLGVAFSQGPGLGPCLRVGASIARALSAAHSVPLIGVNHCIAHIEIGRLLCGCDDPVLLYVSGGNTQVISRLGDRYRVLGETLDIGIGNMLDKFARRHGHAFPGGPIVEQSAVQWLDQHPDQDLDQLQLPYSVHGMDLSFSGALTAANRLVETGQPFGAVCWAVQEHVFAACIEVAERALAHTGKRQLLLGGGVACNRRLTDMASIMCEERGASAHTPERQYCVDNGSMIAVLGRLSLSHGVVTAHEDSAIDQTLRTDQTVVGWS